MKRIRVSNVKRTVMTASFMTLTHVFPQIYLMDKQQKTPTYGRKQQKKKNKGTNKKAPTIQPLPNPYFCQTLSRTVGIFIFFYLDKSYKKPCFTCEIIMIREFVGPV